MNTILQYTIFSKFLSLVQSHSPYGLNLKIYRCMYHRIRAHNFLSFIFYVTSIYHGLLLVFWKGFPCSFSSCGVLRLDLLYSSSGGFSVSQNKSYHSHSRIYLHFKIPASKQLH